MRLPALLVCLLIGVQVIAEPSDVTDIRVEARDLIEKGDIPEAIELLTDQGDSKQWQTVFLLGTAYLLHGDLNAASSALDMALGLNGSVAEVWVQRAVVEQEFGRPETALRLLKVALEIEPDCVEAYLNVGYSYEMMNRPKDARIAYAEYLRLTSGNLAHVGSRREVIVRLSASL